MARRSGSAQSNTTWNRGAIQVLLSWSSIRRVASLAWDADTAVRKATRGRRHGAATMTVVDAEGTAARGTTEPGQGGFEFDRATAVEPAGDGRRRAEIRPA